MPNITQAEYNAYLAKSMRTVADAGGNIPVSKESELHAAILAECKKRGWIAFHGSMAHQTFRTDGEPDFVILADAGRVFLIEAKAKNGKLSPAQAAIHAWASKLGHTVHVVRSFDDFCAILDLARGSVGV